jgi:ribonucleoside-triphosphate reductase
MTGKSHTDPDGKGFALAVMQHMNDKCAEWKAAENIDYSLYGTPIESTTYKFAKALQKDFGKIKDVSDHNYVTNSYHIVVRENINAFDKLSFEAEFQKLSPGGYFKHTFCSHLKLREPTQGCAA